jgi:hypothetical protein
MHDLVDFVFQVENVERMHVLVYFVVWSMDDTCENIVEQQVWKELFENDEVVDMMLKWIDNESSNLDFVECAENFYSCVVLFCEMVFNYKFVSGFN